MVDIGLRHPSEHPCATSAYEIVRGTLPDAIALSVDLQAMVRRAVTRKGIILCIEFVPVRSSWLVPRVACPALLKVLR